MTDDKSTQDLIDEAARTIAEDIIGGAMTANERVKAFQTLIDYRKATATPVESEKAPVNSFDKMRDAIRAVNGEPHESAE